MKRYITARQKGKTIYVTSLLYKTRLSCLLSTHQWGSRPASKCQPFEILEVQTREYSRFNTRGTHWKVRLNPPPETPLPDPVTHFVGSMNNLFYNVLEDVSDDDMVGITIHKEINQSNNPIGFSFRRKDQLSTDVI